MQLLEALDGRGEGFFVISDPRNDSLLSEIFLLLSEVDSQRALDSFRCGCVLLFRGE